MRLENKVAIVTGAGRGLGKGIALKLAQEGAKVIVSDIMQETADECVAEIRQKGGQAAAVVGNIAKLEDVKRVYQAALEIYGKIDIVVTVSYTHLDVYKRQALRSMPSMHRLTGS